MIFGFLICMAKGKHRRGRRIDEDGGYIRYRCPRCGSTWNRKGRRAPA